LQSIKLQKALLKTATSFFYSFAAMPDADFSSWTSPEDMAMKIFEWVRIVMVWICALLWICALS
jgi:hypothetical protein